MNTMTNNKSKKRTHKNDDSHTHTHTGRDTHTHSDSEDSQDEDEDTLAFTEFQTNKANEEMSENEAVDASFDLCDPSEKDFHGVRTFVANAPVFKDCDISAITDCICEQANIGGLWKDDEDKIFGVLSILNTKQYECMTGVVQQLLRLVRKHDKLNDESVWACRLNPQSDTHTGVLINERIVNFPEGLVPIHFTSLQDDVKWSQTTPECPKDEQQYYFFKDYVMIGKCYEDCTQTPSPSKKQNVKNGASSTANTPKLLFPKFEEQFFLAESDMSFLVSTGKHVRIANTQDKKSTCRLLPEFLVVCIVAANKLNNIIKEIKSAVPKDPSIKIASC